MGRATDFFLFFGGLRICIDFYYQIRLKMGVLGDPFLAYFFDFSCTAQGLEFFMLFGTIFEASPKGKSRCFVKDILQKSRKRHPSKREPKLMALGDHFGSKI